MASHDVHAMWVSDCATTTITIGPVKDARNAGVAATALQLPP
jgi:hypothetical protein